MIMSTQKTSRLLEKIMWKVLAGLTPVVKCGAQNSLMMFLSMQRIVMSNFSARETFDSSTRCTKESLLD
jgi:hypothetical protein